MASTPCVTRPGRAPCTREVCAPGRRSQSGRTRIALQRTPSLLPASRVGIVRWVSVEIDHAPALVVECDLPIQRAAHALEVKYRARGIVAERLVVAAEGAPGEFTSAVIDCQVREPAGQAISIRGRGDDIG